MTLIRRKPVGVNSIFDDLFNSIAVSNNGWNGGASVPAINIKKSENGFELELAAPGLAKADFNIEINDGTLTISSESKSEKVDSEDDGQYTRREFSYSSFTRSFSLPAEVDEDKVKATYEDGILKVAIPNSEEKIQKPKQIEIH